MPTLTAPRLRDRFPTLETSTYLVSHSMGAPPTGARDALDAYWRTWAENGPEAWQTFLPQLREIADGVGTLFRAPAGTVSLIPNVSLGVAAIASALDFSGSRNEIVVESLAFPTVPYVLSGWQAYGAKLVTVPSDDGRTMSTERICEAIGDRTALVVLSHAAFQSGALIDAGAIARRCRERGAFFVLDVYQTTGIIPYDVARLGVDAAVGGSHKWLCGGAGCGFVYLAPDARERIAPRVTGWFAHERPFDFAPAPIALADGNDRFYTGTPTVPGYVAAKAGHDAIREIGVENVRAHNVRLAQRLIDGARERDFTIPTPLDASQRTGWIGMDFADAKEACAALVRRRVYVDYRPGCGIRVSPHFYTKDEEIDAFFDAIDDVRRA